MAVTAPGTHNPADDTTIPTAWGDAVNADLINLDARTPAGAWTAYTPTLTAVTLSPTLGTGGTQTGRWNAIGKLITANISVVFGTALVVAGSGAYRIALPTAAQANATILGTGMLYDSSTATMKHVTALFQSSTTLTMYLGDAGAGVFEVTNAVPWTWAANDQIWLNLSYEAA